MKTLRPRQNVGFMVSCLLSLYFAPHLPGGCAFGPHLVERTHIAKGIHAVPEAVVFEAHELPVAGQASERFLLKWHVVALNVLRDARIQLTAR